MVQLMDQIKDTMDQIHPKLSFYAMVAFGAILIALVIYIFSVIYRSIKGSGETRDRNIQQQYCFSCGNKQHLVLKPVPNSLIG